MLKLEDMVAIVKPHNDKIIAEGRSAEVLKCLRRARAALITDLPKEALEHVNEAIGLADPKSR